VALTFGAASSDRVTVTAAGSINNLGSGGLTLIVWCYPTTINAFKYLASKENGTANFEKEFTHNSNGQVSIFVKTSGTGATANTANTAGNKLTTNTWWYVALTLSSGLVPRVYLGSLTANAAEASYATQTTGTGSPSSDSSGNFVTGNDGNGSPTHAFLGRIAHVSYWSRELSLGEIIAQQWRPQMASGCVLMQHLGFAGTGTQPDYSGSNNPGTVTGATVTPDHVPLGRMFGPGDEGLPYVVSAGSTYSDTGTGGLVLAGTATGVATYAPTASGGAVLGGAGAGVATYAPTASGGAVLGGAGAGVATYVPAASGGLAIGGDGVPAAAYAPAAAGGLTVGGAGTPAYQAADVGAGGLALGGAGTPAATYPITTTGGIALGGAGTPAATYPITASGGATVGGAGVDQLFHGNVYSDVGGGGAVLGGAGADGVAANLGRGDGDIGLGVGIRR
jgi:hypothetical protein